MAVLYVRVPNDAGYFHILTYCFVTNKILRKKYKKARAGFKDVLAR